MHTTVNIVEMFHKKHTSHSTTVCTTTNLVGHIHPTVAKAQHVSKWTGDGNEVVDGSRRVEKNNEDTGDNRSPHRHPLVTKYNTNIISKQCSTPITFTAPKFTASYVISWTDPDMATFQVLVEHPNC